MNNVNTWLQNAKSNLEDPVFVANAHVTIASTKASLDRVNGLVPIILNEMTDAKAFRYPPEVFKTMNNNEQFNADRIGNMPCIQLDGGAMTVCSNNFANEVRHGPLAAPVGTPASYSCLAMHPLSSNGNDVHGYVCRDRAMFIPEITQALGVYNYIRMDPNATV